MKSLKNMVQEALGTPSGLVGHRIQISHLTNAQRQYIEIYCQAKQVGGYPETTVYEFPSYKHAEKVLRYLGGSLPYRINYEAGGKLLPDAKVAPGINY